MSRVHVPLFDAPKPALTVVQARKLLGESYDLISDAEIERMITILNKIAVGFVKDPVR